VLRRYTDRMRKDSPRQRSSATVHVCPVSCVLMPRRHGGSWNILQQLPPAPRTTDDLSASRRPSLFVFLTFLYYTLLRSWYLWCRLRGQWDFSFYNSGYFSQNDFLSHPVILWFYIARRWPHGLDRRLIDDWRRRDGFHG
jgi:hypothetical protein